MNKVKRVFGAFLTLGLVSGCTFDHSSDAEHLASRGQSIVFGNASTDPALDAVGGLVFKLARFKITEFSCTATLIAPKVALTARHCVASENTGWHFLPFPSFNNFVVFGDNITRPQQKVKIKGFVTAPPGPGPGLLNDGGRDVAVVFLDEAPAGITPASLGLFEESMVGTQFRIAGFGYTESTGSGVKHEGLATSRALEGEWYPLLFDGNEEAFEAWYWSDSSAAIPSEDEATAWWAPGTYTLEAGYELLAGGLPGESVSCWGDSGGPMFLGSTADDLTVYGVSFAGEGSISSNCALGGGYLVLNEEMLAFVEDAVAQAP